MPERSTWDAEARDAAPVDMDLALLEALENPKVWRRWRDGKKPFTGPR
jgi:hypothetical protein